MPACLQQPAACRPASAEPGITVRWSLPPARRTKCGTIRPTKPTTPAVVTARDGQQGSQCVDRDPHAADLHAQQRGLLVACPEHVQSTRQQQATDQASRCHQTGSIRAARRRQKSPISQKRIPRSLASGLMASIRLTAALQPAATTIPVSSRRRSACPRRCRYLGQGKHHEGAAQGSGKCRRIHQQARCSEQHGAESAVTAAPLEVPST